MAPAPSELDCRFRCFVLLREQASRYSFVRRPVRDPFPAQGSGPAYVALPPSTPRSRRAREVDRVSYCYSVLVVSVVRESEFELVQLVAARQKASIKQPIVPVNAGVWPVRPPSHQTQCG